jgi:predicted DNA-binding transcriptional regulator AlpA
MSVSSNQSPYILRSAPVIDDPRRAILRPADLRRRWGVSKATIARWRAQGVLPAAIKLSAHAICWRLEDVLRFEEARLHAPAPMTATQCRRSLPNSVYQRLS